MKTSRHVKVYVANCAIAVTLSVLQGCGGGGDSPAASPTAGAQTGVSGTNGTNSTLGTGGTQPAGTGGGQGNAPAPGGGNPPPAVGGLPATFTAAFAEKDGTNFYAFDGDSTSAVSADGITWTTSTITGMVGARVIRKLNGSWIAVGLNGGIFTSTNGTSWTSRSSGISGVYIHNVAFDGTRYVAVATPDAANKNITTSSDGGVTWTSVSVGTKIIFLGITHYNGKFYAAGYEELTPGSTRKGEMYTSTNGTTWTRVTLPIVPGLGFVAPLQSITNKGATLIAAGNFGVVYQSIDAGVTWTFTEAAPTSVNLLNVVCSSSRCVASSSGNPARVAYLNDLSKWEWWTTTSQLDIRGIAYNGTRWTVVGEQGFSASSANGIDWTANPIK
jgi:hypothetical protein